MSGIRIGDSACGIDELLEILKREEIKQLHFGKPPITSLLLEFAKYVETPPYLIEIWKSQIEQETKKGYEVIKDILVCWSVSNSDKATLGTLLNIIEEKFIWKIFTDALRNRIQTQATSYNDLDQRSKEQLLECQFNFLGKQTKLRTLKDLISTDMFSQIIDAIDNVVIDGVLRGHTWRFDKFQLPPEPLHYTGRTIKAKCKLSPKIFQKACEDIFIFEGKLPDDLDWSILVKPNPIDVSGGQVETLTVRFILLEEEDHFGLILQKTNKPVHRIKYQENSYYWIRTIGSLRVVREFLSIEEISEDTLINGVLSEPDSKPLAICGGPGTGKSVLLASLANKMYKQYSDRYTIFLNFPDMTRQQTFADIVHDSVDETKLLAELFGSIFAMHKFAKCIFDGLLYKKKARFEIFFDRIDDIPFEQISIAKIFFEKLLKYPSIRIYAAFGPTVRQEIENHLQIISCDIIPLRKDEMESFLSKMVDSQVCQLVLKSVDMLGRNDGPHKETTGSPLLCSMLAAVYSRGTKKFDVDGEISWSKMPIKSLTALYSKYLDIKFEHIGNQNPELLKLLCYREAFYKLFHDHDYDYSRSIIEALNMQINQFTLPTDSFKADFEHKTFSEYCMAQFIVENWKNSTNDERTSLCAFIYDTLFTTCKAEENDALAETFNEIKDDTLGSVMHRMSTGTSSANDTAVAKLIMLGWEKSLEYIQISVLKGNVTFRRSAICFFLNELISNEKSLEFKTNTQENLRVTPTLDEKFARVSKDFISKILLFVSFGYEHLFGLTTESLKETTGSNYFYVDHQTCQTILILAARQENVQKFQYFCKLVEAIGNTDITSIVFPCKSVKKLIYEHTPLHEAAKLGNYTLFEHLFNVYRSNVQSMSGLVQVCLSDSSSNFKHVIKNKNKILRLLCSENIKYDFKDIKGSLLDGIHVTLFTKVCDMVGYTLSEKDVKWLYKFVVCYFTKSDQMDVFVTWLLSKDLMRLILYSYEEKNSLLIDALRQHVLGPQSLQNIYNSQYFDLGSIIYYVRKCKNRHLLVKKMIDLAGDINLADPYDPKILHWAACMYEFDPMKSVIYERLGHTNIRKRLHRHKMQQAELLYNEIINLLKENQLTTNVGNVEQIQYDSKEILGRGTFGIVYNGTLNERQVAVKKLNYEPLQKDLVDRETKLLCECDGHENIVKCFFIQKSVSTVLIALEICKFTLEQWVTMQRSTDTVQARQLLFQTTKGLDFLHSKNVVHLDITPHNILLNPIYDDEIKIKISDFGNSRKLPITKADIKLETGFGTIDWMAPEVIKTTLEQDQAFSRDLTTAADIFSLGCVLYYVMSSGVHPFGANPESRKSNILLNNPLVNTGLLKNPLFIHLFHLMTNQTPLDRPTAAALLKHHIFWSEDKMLNFLVSVSNAANLAKVNSKISNIMDTIEDYPLIKPYYEPQSSRGWIRFLCSDVQKYVLGIGSKRKSYDGELFFDLLRAIRNMQAHSNELPKNVQKAVGLEPNTFMKYWLKRFAIVFEIVWLHFEDMKDDPSSSFLEYYSKKYSFHRTDISECADKILAKYVRNQCTEMVLRGATV